MYIMNIERTELRKNRHMRKMIHIMSTKSMKHQNIILKRSLQKIRQRKIRILSKRKKLRLRQATKKSRVLRNQKVLQKLAHRKIKKKRFILQIQMPKLKNHNRLTKKMSQRTKKACRMAKILKTKQIMKVKIMYRKIMKDRKIIKTWK